jgi:hypothetical protein
MINLTAINLWSLWLIQEALINLTVQGSFSWSRNFWQSDSYQSLITLTVQEALTIWLLSISDQSDCYQSLITLTDSGSSDQSDWLRELFLIHEAMINLTAINIFTKSKTINQQAMNYLTPSSYVWLPLSSVWLPVNSDLSDCLQSLTASQQALSD